MLPTTIGDVITIQTALHSVSLSELWAVREHLDQVGSGPVCPSFEHLEQVLGDYVAEQDEAEVALRGIVTALTRYDTNQGSALIVQGPARCGKSHLLTAAALLLEYSAAWPTLLSSHPQFSDLQQRAEQQAPLLTVPIPLAEHRGDREHLEDIVFERTEQELARAKYDVATPLSQQSYALDLIRRHMVPRYAAQLNEKIREYPSGYTTLDQLVQHDPDEAIRIARQVAQQLGYPLDFRQSRTERLSRLSQIVAERNLRGVVWMIDDVSGFLASVDPKAVHNDCGFLEFLAQRSKIEPLHLLVALEEGFEQVGGLEPYLLSSIRVLYDATFKLSTAQMHRVAREHLHPVADRKTLEQAAAEAYHTYLLAFGEPSFTLAELVDSYPLHPLASQSLETTIQRYLGTADGLLQFVTAPADQGGLADYLARDCHQLLGPVEIAAFLRSVLASHPQAASLFAEVEDFYERNAAQIVPEDPQGSLDLVRSLIVLRLGNVSASVNILAECLGLTQEGSCRATPEQVRELLETMRVMGSYVDVRRGPDPASSVYLVEASTSLTQLVRRRLNTLKATFADDDPRLWRRMVACSDGPGLPLAELTRSQLYEVIWENSYRQVRVETANLSTLTTAQLAAYTTELADPRTGEDCRLFLGGLAQPQAQTTSWPAGQVADLQSRWAAGLLAWLPRPLTVQEIDVIKQCVACHELLHQPCPEAELQAAWRSHLLEERTVLDNQVRQITAQAYHEGRIVGVTEGAVEADELAVTKGDWLATLAVATRPAFLALHSDFPAIAPRRPVTSREQIDKLISEVIAVTPLEAEPESSLRELCEAFLVPLGLATCENSTIRLQVAHSPVAQEIIRIIRQRDQTPEHEQGRALSCPDLAQHLLKSPLGLPPELFELTVAALVRLGYLVALDESRRPLHFGQIELPFSAEVHYIARPPLLPLSTWQVLSRLARILLSTGIPGPDYAVQQHIWEQLISKREEQLSRLAQLQDQLEQLWQSLDQKSDKWQQALIDLNDAVEFFEMIDSGKHSAVGLAELLSRLEPYMTEDRGPLLLTSLLQRIDKLEGFLQEVGPILSAVKRYLDSPQLQLAANSELDRRRQSLVELIDSGEEILGEELAFRRYLQRFLTGYKRQYLAWHNQVYRDPIFEQYRAVRSAAEYRALTQLGRLDIEVEHNVECVTELINSYVARCCHHPDLAGALDRSPVCPSCRLKLEEELHFPSIPDLKEVLDAGLREYVQLLGRPQFRQQLIHYATAIPCRADIPDKLRAIAQLPVEPTSRQILTLFTADVITHLNRVLAGKALVPRDLAELREVLAGRTLTKEEAQELFMTWLEGTEGDLGDGELLDIEE